MSEFSLFRMKHFVLFQCKDVFKVGTDAMVLGAWTSLDIKPSHILDIGTGSGVLSLMMSQKFPEAKIIAIDSNPNAVDLANQNFLSNHLGKNCSALLMRFEDYQPDKPFDLIVSNPPFFVNSKKSESALNMAAKHLNQSGLESFFELIKRSLSTLGRAFVVHPPQAGFELAASQVNLCLVQQLQVFGNDEKLVRCCSVFANKPEDFQLERLVIRRRDGKYTEEYKLLTQDFHGVDL